MTQFKSLAVWSAVVAFCLAVWTGVLYSVGDLTGWYQW